MKILFELPILLSNHDKVNNRGISEAEQVELLPFQQNIPNITITLVSAPHISMGF